MDKADGQRRQRSPAPRSPGAGGGDVWEGGGQKREWGDLLEEVEKERPNLPGISLRRRYAALPY
eukprot:271100-Rhodomonas_salina.1